MDQGVGKESMVAPMWRMNTPAGQITSADFINGKNQSNPRAFYGRMWRFKKDQDYQRDLAARRAAFQAEEAAKRQKSQAPKPLDNYLVDEAKKMAAEGVQPVAISQPDSVSLEEMKSANDAYLARLQEQGLAKFTEAQLKEVSKDDLEQMAAAVGIANVKLPKQKLIEAILAAQS